MIRDLIRAVLAPLHDNDPVCRYLYRVACASLAAAAVCFLIALATQP